MKVIDLLLRPLTTIAEFLTSDPRPWLLPLVAYFFLAFAETLNQVFQLYPSWRLLNLTLFALGSSLLWGTWSFAAVYGGGLHLAARAVGGRRGIADTLRAVGYGSFWPGVAGAMVTTLLTLHHRRHEGSTSAALVALQIGVACWAIYGAVASLRIGHALAWWRAALAYLLFFVAIVAISFVVFFVLRVVSGR